jgi:hypothetical protein
LNVKVKEMKVTNNASISEKLMRKDIATCKIVGKW